MQSTNLDNIIRLVVFLVDINSENFSMLVACKSMVPIAQVVERPLRELEAAGSKPGRAIPKA